MSQISIVIPVYNAEPYISKCLDSVLCQTFEDYDVFAVDDGSTDRSGAILDQYARTNSRLRVIHQFNGGEMAARATGVRNSRSTWICFVDADDAISSDALDAMFSFASPTIDIVNFEAKDEIIIDMQEFARRLLNFSLWNVWGKLFRRDLFDDYVLTVPREIKVGGDFITQIRLLKNIKKRIAISSQSKYKYNQFNPNSVQLTHKSSYEYEREVILLVGDGLNRCQLSESVKEAYLGWRLEYLAGMIGYKYSINFDDDWISSLQQDARRKSLSAKQRMALAAINHGHFRALFIIERRLKNVARRIKNHFF